MPESSVIFADERRLQRERLTVAYEMQMQRSLTPQERRERIRRCFGDGLFPDEKASA